MEIERAYAQALLVDRAALDGFQEANDALMATETLKAAFRTDVEPILAMARLREGRRRSTRSRAFRRIGLPATASRRSGRRSRAGGGGIV